MSKTQSDYSTKHKKYKRYTQDLITTIEATINSPTSSRGTKNTQNRYTIDRTQTSAKGFSTLDQQILQELNSVFITSEEEIVIRQILELTRKGKIDAGNAFQIPLKVIDPTCTEGMNVKFWKLASEILASSTNIYDKRVDCVYLNSNKIVGELQRLKQKDQFLQQSMSRSHTRQKSMQKSIDLHRSVQTLKVSTNEVKYFHVEHAQKINLSQAKRVYHNNSLLLLNTKGIDSNSISGLMLNTLEIGSDLRIELYSNFKEQGLPKVQRQGRTIENFILKQLQQNFSSLCQFGQRKMFTQIGRYRDRHLPIDLEEQNIFERFLNTDNHPHEPVQILSSLNINPQESGPSQAWSQDFKTIEMGSSISRLKESQLSHTSKEIFEKSFTTNIQGKKGDSIKIVGPWEMEFKQMKLQKKTKNKNTSKELKKNFSKSQQDKDEQIDFSIDSPLKRAQIFSRVRNQQLKINSSKYTQDKYLLPKAINPHIQIDKKRVLRKIANITKQQSENTQIPPIQQISVDKESAFLTAQMTENIEQNYVQKLEIFHDYHSKIQQQTQIDLSPQQARNMQTFGIRNIRQIKQLIYAKLTQQGSIQISQVQCGLTPAEMLIVFLHLANQKNLGIQSTDNECNVRLFIPN